MASACKCAGTHVLRAYANIPGIVGGNIKVIPVDGLGIKNSNHYALRDEGEEAACDLKHEELPGEEDEKVADAK